MVTDDDPANALRGLRAAHPDQSHHWKMLETPMTDTSMLPKSGEAIILPDGTALTVAWCSGWTWPLTEPAPTRLYAQAKAGDTIVPGELRVIAARDALGTRFWIAERRPI